MAVGQCRPEVVSFCEFISASLSRETGGLRREDMDRQEEAGEDMNSDGGCGDGGDSRQARETKVPRCSGVKPFHERLHSGEKRFAVRVPVFVEVEVGGA